MTGLIMAAQLIAGLAILVTLHELGHYLAARAFGIRVEKFYLFFDAWGVKLFSTKKGDTEYGIGWLPLGGYVKISGMIDESMDKEAMKQPPQPWEFRSKPAWQRLIVMVAGVTMNVILGIVIYTYILLHFNQKYLANKDVNDGIYAYELGEKAGLKTGDKILEINSKPFERFEELLSARVIFGSHLTVLRDGKTFDLEIPSDFYREVTKAGRGNFIGPYRSSILIDSILPGKPAEIAGVQKGDKLLAINGKRIFSETGIKKDIQAYTSKPITLRLLRGSDSIEVKPIVSDSGIIGMMYHPDLGNYPLTDYTLASALSMGTSDAVNAVVSNIKGLKQIFIGKEKASDALQGPIGIATIYGGVWDWSRFWTITGLLSMVLAFMNILPIPALDGGHAVFLIIETVTRKKFSDKVMERAQVVGMVLLIGLMLFAVGNDIWKHILN
jgi:regulator of sigma E protease